MSNYSASGSQTVIAAPGATVVAVEASALTRGKLFFFLVAAQGIPDASNTPLWRVRRFTAPGTRTAVTPVPFDPSDPNAQLAAGENHTAEPTYTTGLFNPIPLNQRSVYQWNSHPGREIMVPATASAGVGISAENAAYAGDVSAVMHWTE